VFGAWPCRSLHSLFLVAHSSVQAAGMVIVTLLWSKRNAQSKFLLSKPL
jgi:hypothetical protein